MQTIIKTKQLSIPELTPDNLGGREAARQAARDGNASGGSQLMKIALTAIVIRKNFNVRHEMGDIQALAESISENGQSQPGTVDILADGTFLLVDGHRRFEALKLNAANNDGEGYFIAMVNNQKTSEEQRLLQMFTSQDNKALEPLEVAELLTRLLNLGYKPAAIATKIGKSATYVGNMLGLHKESPLVKEEIKNGNIKTTEVFKLQKSIPVASERTNAIVNAGASKTANKKTGISAKSIVGQKLDSFKELKAVLKALDTNGLADCKLEVFDFAAAIIENEYTKDQIIAYFAQ